MTIIGGFYGSDIQHDSRTSTQNGPYTIYLSVRG